MRSMFLLSKFNGDISLWDVSKVEDMELMFRSSHFNGDISQWNVSSVKNMSNMFGDSRFNKDISSWDVSKVEDMTAMFVRSKFNKDISQWNVRDDCDVAYALSDSPAEAHPSFGKLHFMCIAMNPLAMHMNPAVDKTMLHWISVAESIHGLPEDKERSKIGAHAWHAYRQSLAPAEQNIIDLPTLE